MESNSLKFNKMKKIFTVLICMIVLLSCQGSKYDAGFTGWAVASGDYVPYGHIDERYIRESSVVVTIKEDKKVYDVVIAPCAIEVYEGDSVYLQANVIKSVKHKKK